MKKRYADAFRWSLKLAPWWDPSLFPSSRVVEAVLVVYSYGKPDNDNWSKWAKDALSGFAVRDDGDDFLSFEVRPLRGKPAAFLYLRETAIPAPPFSPRKPRRTARPRLSKRDRFFLDLSAASRSPRDATPGGRTPARAGDPGPERGSGRSGPLRRTPR